MNKLMLASLTGFSSLVVGVLVGSTANDAIKIGLLSTASAIGSGYLTYIVVDTKSTNKLRCYERKFNELKTGKQIDEKLLLRKDDELAAINKQLRNACSELLSAKTENEKLNKLVDSIKPLATQLEKLQAELVDYKSRNHELEIINSTWEDGFHNKLNEVVNERVQEMREQEIQRIFDEHDQITSEAMQLAREMQVWGVRVAQGHQAKKDTIRHLVGEYNTNLDEVKTAVETETDRHLRQIEILNERIGILQQQLHGELLEPKYVEVGYNPSGNIAKSIVEIVWHDLNIPLALKGFCDDSSGSTMVGLGYSASAQIPALIEALRRHSDNICKRLGIYKITSVKKHEVSDLIVLTFRREMPIKEDQIKDFVSSAGEFINYIVSNPIRYRLIADPGVGKTPSTAVMVSEILKVGCTRGNTGKGVKIPNTLVTVSCPDVVSSQKDGDSYPLLPFLKYGDSTAAIKSFDDAFDDWEYRKQNTKYAENYFGLWVWDELDNTINLADNPKELGETFKVFLKQAHHTGLGWIVSGQSVMTSQIPGFRDDDRSLFTEIIIGVKKIRTYLEKYGNKVLNKSLVAQLQRNLELIEAYQDDKNSSITDEAKKYRLALVLDDKSPKLYWMPNLDMASFDADQIEQLNNQAKLEKLGKCMVSDTRKPSNDSQKSDTETLSKNQTNTTTLVKGDLVVNVPDTPKPHCVHCGSGELKAIEKGYRYHCLNDACGKRFVAKKAVWR
jgi:hypothetical protein